MKVEIFTEVLGADFYVGVPDSQLKPLCNYLMKNYGIDDKHHIIAANEGNCTAIAAGYNLATGKIPAVYLQNSGEGNIVNPVLSLLSPQVYSIPMIFVVGWRGEPNIHDEPQHIHQGAVTLKLLEDLGIKYFVVDKNTSVEDLKSARENFQSVLETGQQIAFVIRKGALTYDEEINFLNDYKLIREEVINSILDAAQSDIIVATTGKIGREVFMLRDLRGEAHSNDFLTVGSMGHCSSIALGIALNCPDKKIWCIDGDGAFLMHMGAAAVIGAYSPKNLIHIVINNNAHESVGGLPTVADKIDFVSVARACGYKYCVSLENISNLEKFIEKVKPEIYPLFIEIKCAIGSRKNLGRPTISPLENKINFCNTLNRRS